MGQRSTPAFLARSLEHTQVPTHTHFRCLNTRFRFQQVSNLREAKNRSYLHATRGRQDVTHAHLYSFVSSSALARSKSVTVV